MVVSVLDDDATRRETAWQIGYVRNLFIPRIRSGLTDSEVALKDQSTLRPQGKATLSALSVLVQMFNAQAPSEDYVSTNG